MLDHFSPPVRVWFEQTFGQPTPPQAQGWPPIQRGEHTLILAPTGSGKTLAAFLWGIDQTYRAVARDAAGVLLVYVSPLKALNNDIERNLRTPLEGIRATATRMGLDFPPLRVAVRTGDMPGHQRAQMVKRPPHILITTPESLYLMLTSARAREMFRSVRTVIVDEIHTLCGDKRGVHLSLSLERLCEIASEPVQRIGLSATIQPLDEAARFLGGQESALHPDPLQAGADRPVTIANSGYRKPLDVQVITAVADFHSMTGSTIWPSLIPQVLQKVRQHRTTLIFCNNRRLAERTADRLNAQLAAEQTEEIPPGSTEALAPGGVARDGGLFAIGAVGGPFRAHHGSMSKEARRDMEEALKDGRLPALVGTSSLELGIDIGAVDLVVQLQSPKSVAQGLQRVGRSGHRVGQTSVGHIYPTFREDLVEAAAVARGMIEGDVEPVYTPQNPLDVLAQQIVAMVAVEDWDVDALYALVRRAYAYHSLTRASFHLILDMLSGKYYLNDDASVPSPKLGEGSGVRARVPSTLRPRISWDRVNNRLAALPGSRLLAIAQGGTITDRGAFGVYLADGKTKLGELDEEFVYESRVGNTFLLGSNVWRVLNIADDRVIVGDAAGATPRMPFWRGDYPWRAYELGVRVGRFRRELAERLQVGGADLAPVTAWLTATYHLDERSASNLLTYIQHQLDSHNVISSDTTIVVESFLDAVGDRQLVIQSPFGGRVNGAWALALNAAIRERSGVEVETQANDDGIIMHFAHTSPEPPLDLIQQMTPSEAREHILRALPGSALFGARFRMNAARALLLPVAAGHKRTPFWLQRLRARDLLAAVRQFDDFPMVAETYRDCLTDALDLPHLEELLASIQSGAVRVVPVESVVPSPIASGLLFNFANQYLYEWDAPKAERQLQTLAVRRDVLADLLQGGDLRGLLKPEAIAEVASRFQRRALGYQARSMEELAVALRELGDLSDEEARMRSAGDCHSWLEQLSQQGRITRISIPTSSGIASRWVPVELAEEYRRAFALSATDAERVLRRALRHVGPQSRADILGRYAFDEAWLADTLANLVNDGTLARGRFSPQATADEYCDQHNLEQMHHRTLSLLRKEVQPVPPHAYTDFLFRWQHVHPASHTLARGEAGLRAILQQLRGVALPLAVWEREILPSRIAGEDEDALDTLCQSGEVAWVASGKDAQHSRVRFMFRGEGALLLGSPAPDVSLLSTVAQSAYRFLQEEGASFTADMEAGLGIKPSALSTALAELATGGLVTNDTLDALRQIAQHSASPEARAALSPLEAELSRRPQAALRRPTPSRFRDAKRRVRARLKTESASTWPGRWSLVHRVSLLGPALSDEERASRLARVLLARYGVLMRECLESEEGGDWSQIYPHLERMEMRGELRRGYFVSGLSGAQFALPEAVEHLRAASAATDDALVTLNATDPAILPGAAFSDGSPRFARVPSTHCLWWRGRLVLAAEDGGKRITTGQDIGRDIVERALQQYVSRVSAPGHLVVAAWNGLPILETEGQAFLRALGFSRAPAAMERWR